MFSNLKTNTGNVNKCKVNALVRKEIGKICFIQKHYTQYFVQLEHKKTYNNNFLATF